MYEALSDILASAMIAELELNADFVLLTDAQQLTILNSGQQLVCDLYNAKEKDDYLVNTSMYTIPT
jgi:hypothetical protein